MSHDDDERNVQNNLEDTTWLPLLLLKLKLIKIINNRKCSLLLLSIMRHEMKLLFYLLMISSEEQIKDRKRSINV